MTENRPRDDGDHPFGRRTEDGLVVPFDAGAMIALAIRSDSRLGPADRRAIASILRSLPAPDVAAGRLVSDWLLRKA